MPEIASSHGKALKKCTLFSGFSEEEFAQLLRYVVARSYAPGEIVFSEDEPCVGLYVVESGCVRIFKSSTGGREQVLSIEGPGGSVAELPVFDGGNYPASVAATEDTVLLFVPKLDFHALCLAHPQVALKVLKVLGGRLRRLVGIIEELSFTTVRSRLGGYLLRLAQKEGKRLGDGVQVELPTNNQELAAQIGTVRELVSRNLSRLQAAGVIRIDGRTVLIRDLKALESETEPADQKASQEPL